jgi:phosphoribosylformylglycinamidine synthase
MRRIISEGLAESAHDLADGGLAVAAAECSFGAAGIGARLEVDSDLAPEFLLFHEGPSRILLSTSEPGKITALARDFGVESAVVGVTIKGKLQLSNRSQVLLDCELLGVKDQWQTALERKLSS